MRRSALWTVMLSFLLLGLFSAANLRAQERQAGQEPTSAAEPSRHETPGQELAHETREAAGEDTQSNLKHSPSVQFISRVTGLSMEGSFWLGQAINFGVIAIAILWISKKSLPGLFRNRTLSIQKAMDDARKTSEDANQRLAEIEARLSKLDSEISGMRAAAEKETMAEEARIQAAAQEDARKIVDSAEQEIAAAAKQARRELTAYAADLAVTLAKQQIRIDSATDQALVNSFAQGLTGNGSGSRGKS